MRVWAGVRVGEWVTGERRRHQVHRFQQRSKYRLSAGQVTGAALTG